ncbi:MAG TPA: tetratricopeptide repeat protein [Acidimicrobiales bacterium]|nr:tetratricopeptide repeat protein [Acidimicrobiales bacterium]
MPTPAEAAAPAAATPPPATPPLPSTSSAETILSRGQAAFDRGDYPEAIRRAKEATAMGAAVPGHLLVADSYYHLQRFADALREYEAALALEPSNALAKRGRELATKAAATEASH